MAGAVAGQEGEWEVKINNVDSAADYILTLGVVDTVVVGPILWQPSDGLASKRFYFVIAAGGRKPKFLLHGIDVPEDEADSVRAQLIAALMRPSFTIHVVDDELAMARICEQIWPCERSRGLRKSVEREREGAA
jgi:hypothetical protein